MDAHQRRRESLHPSMFYRRPNAACLVCEKPVYRRPADLAKSNGRAYCGQKCYGKACRKEHPCPVCGTTVLASQHTKCCSRDCADRIRTSTVGRKRGERRSWQDLRLERIARIGRCERCGYDTEPQILNAHHRIPRSRGGVDTDDNMELLCPNCHAIEHLVS